MRNRHPRLAVSLAATLAVSVFLVVSTGEKPTVATVSPRLGRFLGDRKGTPSIETVTIIAFIALALFPYLRDVGGTIGNVFGHLTQNLNSQVNP